MIFAQRGGAFVRHSTGLCVLFVVVGAILGGLLGNLLSKVDALSGFMPYLTESYPVFDMAPVTVNLYVIKLTVGLAFMPNFMSILGIVLALFLFRRY